jgi:hypothetical protein
MSILLLKKSLKEMKNCFISMGGHTGRNNLPFHKLYRIPFIKIYDIWIINLYILANKIYHEDLHAQ